MSVKEIVKNEIDRLPEDILAEVFDFIRFLETKKERNLLVKDAQKLSLKSFEKIWNNEEDSVYDNL